MSNCESSLRLPMSDVGRGPIEAAFSASAGTENPMTVEVGKDDLELPSPPKSEAHDFLTIGAAGGAGTSERDTGECEGAPEVAAASVASAEGVGVENSSLTSCALDESALGAASETEVFVDNGDPGTKASGAVDTADSVSVAELDIGSDRGGKDT